MYEKVKTQQMFIWRFPGMGGTPIAGWFIMEHPSINGRFGVTPILGNLHIHLSTCLKFLKMG
jgi:hypothetical protein